MNNLNLLLNNIFSAAEMIIGIISIIIISRLIGRKIYVMNK